jgi:HEPN domain-containing protein
MAGNYDWACFISQQAAEKALKALSLFLGGEAWGHSDEKHLIGLKDFLEVTNELLNHAKRLTTFISSAHTLMG